MEDVSYNYANIWKYIIKQRIKDSPVFGKFVSYLPNSLYDDLFTYLVTVRGSDCPEINPRFVDKLVDVARKLPSGTPNNYSVLITERLNRKLDSWSSDIHEALYRLAIAATYDAPASDEDDEDDEEFDEVAHREQLLEFIDETAKLYRDEARECALDTLNEIRKNEEDNPFFELLKPSFAVMQEHCSAIDFEPYLLEMFPDFSVDDFTFADFEPLHYTTVEGLVAEKFVLDAQFRKEANKLFIEQFMRELAHYLIVNMMNFSLGSIPPVTLKGIELKQREAGTWDI